MKSLKIGFIGTGVMGASMAGHLIAGGHQLFIFNGTKGKAKELIERGAVWKDTPAQVAEEADIVITILGYPQDVEAIYLGEEGIVEAAKAGSVFIDMTTSSPALAVKIAEAANLRGISVLDAPVSGGDLGAKNATLSIMVGGAEATFDKVKPVFDLMGKNCVYQGPAGSGQHTKMSNQIAIAAGMLGVCESLAYAIQSGLNPETVLKSIESGAAASWSLSNLGRRMLDGNMAPGFYVKHFIKDMRIALESAQNLGMKTPGLELALQRYLELEKQFGGDDGTQGLFRLY